ncbi:unannotated protein [freshwater metagenome]|uniref:Unannotated protein n=1 Tax=freshwater metagenome TaxID=449393 RepID=A0A6J7UVN5_9ZZZZ
MNQGGFETCERRQVSADIAAIRVESNGLNSWIEDPIRIRVRASTRRPLPVQLVIGNVGICEELHEVSGSDSPVQVQVFSQEGCNHHARSVMHKSFKEKLLHGCIHKWIPRASLPPGLCVLLILTPDVTAIPVVNLRDLWTR